MPRTYISFIVVGLLAAVAMFLEANPAFNPVKLRLQSNEIPAAYLDQGSLGRNLKKMNLVYSVRNDSSVFKQSNASHSSEEAGPETSHPEKRAIGAYLYRFNRDGPEGLPSSAALESVDVIGKWPVISLVTDDDHLFGSSKGIISNPDGRGEEWERPAYLTYYEDAQLQFATGVGLRLHGSREIGESLEAAAYRFYFRDRYGLSGLRPGQLFENSQWQIGRVVARLERGGWPTNEFAYDIARRIGAVVPASTVALLYVNGNYLGPRSVTEHVSEVQWRRRLGHRDFVFFRFKSTNDRETVALYRQLGAWVKKQSTLDIGKANNKFDVDNLSRNLFTFMFLGTTDWFQGAAVFDLSLPIPRWRWIVWDLDHSFKDKARKNARETWEQEAFRLIVDRNSQGEWVNPYRAVLRSDLFARLLNDSVEFREFFARMAMDLLNHKLTEDYFTSLVAEHRDMVRHLPKSEHRLQSLENKRQFLMHRPDFVREDIAASFGIGAIHKVEIVGLPNQELLVDGFPWREAYIGQYFHGANLTVQSVGSGVKSWKVNGRKVKSEVLTISVESDLVVKPELPQFALK